MDNIENRLYDLNYLPPAIPLLINEVLFKSSDRREARKNLKNLLPELKIQSEAYLYGDIDTNPSTHKITDFNIFMDGGLDLLNHNVGCQEINCRIQAAQHICRSIGLIADNIWLHDFLTENFCNFGRITNTKLDIIINDILVLNELLPFILSGIIKFKSPLRAICKNCLYEFNLRVSTIVDEFLNKHSTGFTIESLENGGYALDTNQLYDPNIIIHVYPKKIRKQLHMTSPEDLKKYIVESAVRSALYAGADAHNGHGTVFSNSRLGVATLAQKDGFINNYADQLVFEEQRTFDIPWVSKLTPLQIIQLRNEACKALPAFREQLVKYFNSENATLSIKDIISDLRQQAVETKNEIENAKKSSSTFWKTGYAVLGLGISAYGVATQDIVPAVGGLLPIIQLIMDHKTGTEKELDKIQRKSSYVLVKAQNILEHANGQNRTKSL